MGCFWETDRQFVFRADWLLLPMLLLLLLLLLMGRSLPFRHLLLLFLKFLRLRQLPPPRPGLESTRLGLRAWVHEAGPPIAELRMQILMCSYRYIAWLLEINPSCVAITPGRIPDYH